VSTPSLPAEAAAAVVNPFTLVFSTGERAQVVGRGLIGRMPVAPANETWDHLIVVSDPSKTVSKTHLRVEVLAEGLMVTDLDSANGTVVSMPGIAAERLAPHERVILRPGASVGIGDQSFTVQ
jgi:predicted component of type VI protein secretion system